ncbi:MAG: hypothetical protein ABSE62_04875 [Chthoniobacteraceae bacterium]|jgi:hypothetical protein
MISPPAMPVKTCSIAELCAINQVLKDVLCIPEDVLSTAIARYRDCAERARGKHGDQDSECRLLNAEANQLQILMFARDELKKSTPSPGLVARGSKLILERIASRHVS